MRNDLDTVLDRYDHDELRVAVSHDGFRIYHEPAQASPSSAGQSVWSWDPAHDREPFEAIKTLFDRLGFEVEEM